MSARRGPRGVVRIQAGRWKGRALAVPTSARPTSGRARAALFDLLGGRLAGARVLDLYAGSGAVGIEAVSRGAAVAVLVERDAAEIVRSLERWGVAEEEVRVVAEPVARAVRRLASEGRRFDLIFADPPYARETSPEELSGLPGLLAAGGVVVVQADADSGPPRLPGLTADEGRAYGRNVFHFLGVFDATGGKC